MQHLGTKRLETSRLILRPFCMEDAQDMFDNWASDPEVTKFLTWKTHESPKTTSTILKLWCGSYAQPDFYQWAIELKETGKAIGSISVVGASDLHEWAEVGYCIGRPWWGNGITSEALAAVMDYLFDEVGYNRVQADHDVRNPGSGGVMKKCGMRFEGIRRQGAKSNMGFGDMACYAMLACDRSFPS